MRNLSFALTTPQIRARTKTVTRRKGIWWAGVLRPGVLVCAVEKSQGIKKGELRRLAVLRVRDVRIERLDEMAMEASYGATEARLEGFPGKTGQDFVELFTGHVGGESGQIVTRVEFEYALCAHCNEGEPVCLGQYEGMTEPAPACADCCGHWNEDGRCDPLAARNAT